MVVVPGVNVVWTLPATYVAPLDIVITESTMPMSVRDEDKLIIMSFGALVMTPLESRSCMKKTELYKLLSAGILVGPTDILNCVGEVAADAA